MATETQRHRGLGVTILGVLSLSAFAASPAAAHHDFAVTWDPGSIVEICGVVTKAEFINPHARLLLDVKEKDGTTTAWLIELDSPNVLVRRGVTRAVLLNELLPSGTLVLVQGFRHWDDSPSAGARTIVRADGRRDTQGYFSTTTVSETGLALHHAIRLRRDDDLEGNAGRSRRKAEPAG